MSKVLAQQVKKTSSATLNDSNGVSNKKKDTLKLNRAVKVRLYPNKQQANYFDCCFGCCRFVWNQMLGDMKQFYEETNTFFIPTPAKYKAQYRFLKNVDSLALCDTRLDLVAALNKFLKEKNVGFPKFKSKKHCKHSYTTNCQTPKGGNPTIEIIDDKHLKLPIVGTVRMVLHRSIPENWKLKSATVSQTKSGKYFASLLFEFEISTPKSVYPTAKTILGLDYSSPNFYVDSNGNLAEAEQLFRKAEKKLAREQRNLSRKHMMSNNYKKQKRKLAAAQEKVANQRKDFCHKKSAAITKQYDAVCVEDINLRGMAGSLHLGKSTNDNGFGMFRNMLKYKLEERGKQYIVIDKWYPSSKRCHDCGFVNKELTLNDREWICPQCGVIHLRDVNAAQNIRDEGLCKLYKDLAFARMCA